MQDEEIYRSWWQGIRDQYKGYEIDFCYHSCDIPTDFMAEIHATLLDDRIKMRLAPDAYTQLEAAKALGFTHSGMYCCYRGIV